MTHKNNHARSKQKRKKLRLKNFFRSVFDRRLKKRQKAMEPKGKTVVGAAITHALDFTGKNFFAANGGWFDHQHAMNLNQRQKRKRARHSNNYKKAA